MNVTNLKEYIYTNKKIEFILDSIGCHSIKNYGTYITCANKDGDNKVAVTVYNNPQLSTINYTKPDFNTHPYADLFTLIEYNKGINFFKSLKYVHDILELDFYKEPKTDVPYSLILTKELEKIKNKIKQIEEDNEPIEPIDEIILTYYHPFVNDFWKNDGVDYETQREWELGYDSLTNRITIPIRDEIGNLVGVKGRLFKTKEEMTESEPKFLYIEPCPRHKLLYGLYKTYPHIQSSRIVYCFESEKAVHQAWNYNYKNSIAFGGKKISKTQADKLIRLNSKIVLCLDKDVSRDELENYSNLFYEKTQLYGIIDDSNILSEKQSPTDDIEKFKYLLKNNIYKLK